jgi:hypothetical protein
MPRGPEHKRHEDSILVPATQNFATFSRISPETPCSTRQPSVHESSRHQGHCSTLTPPHDLPSPRRRHRFGGGELLPPADSGGRLWLRGNAESSSRWRRYGSSTATASCHSVKAQVVDVEAGRWPRSPCGKPDRIRIERRARNVAPRDLRRTCARLCHEAGGELEQIQFRLGHRSVQTTERYLGCKQRLRNAVNDRTGLEPANSSGR